MNKQYMKKRQVSNSEIENRKIYEQVYDSSLLGQERCHSDSYMPWGTIIPMFTVKCYKICSQQFGMNGPDGNTNTTCYCVKMLVPIRLSKCKTSCGSLAGQWSSSPCIIRTWSPMIAICSRNTKMSQWTALRGWHHLIAFVNSFLWKTTLEFYNRSICKLISHCLEYQGLQGNYVEKQGLGSLVVRTPASNPPWNPDSNSNGGMEF